MTPRKLMTPTLVAFILAGCASAPETPQSASPSPAAVTAKQEPTKPTQSNSSDSKLAVPPETVAKTDEPKQDEPKQEKPKDGKKRTIPERGFQLDELEKVTIAINGHKFKCWVMDTDMKIQEGMMHLDESDVADDECMIFVFDPPRQLGFWMRNCHYDIDVAFVSASKKILNTPRMRAYDETSVPSKGPAKYAIEFRAGMFKKWGIQPGQTVTIPDSVKAKS